MNAPVLRSQEAAVFRLIFIGIMKARTPSASLWYNTVVATIWKLNNATFLFLVLP